MLGFFAEPVCMLTVSFYAKTKSVFSKELRENCSSLHKEAVHEKATFVVLGVLSAEELAPQPD